MREGGRGEEGEGGTEPKYRCAITVDRKASRNRWPSRRLCVSRRCWMKLLREVPRFGTRIFSNEEFGLESNFGRGRGVGFWSVIRVGLRFLMFFF